MHLDISKPINDTVSLIVGYISLCEDFYAIIVVL